jgi:HTH-type transcriptional regulator / antitoxin HigA
MKATLFVIENEADHAQAKALIEKLMGSNHPADHARMTAQARLIEALSVLGGQVGYRHYRICLLI